MENLKIKANKMTNDTWKEKNTIDKKTSDIPNNKMSEKDIWLNTHKKW